MPDLPEGSNFEADLTFLEVVPLHAPGSIRFYYYHILTVASLHCRVDIGRGAPDELCKPRQDKVLAAKGRNHLYRHKMTVTVTEQRLTYFAFSPAFLAKLPLPIPGHHLLRLNSQNIL